MVTATVPRNEVYLSLLAARAVTSLVSLAGDPEAWSQRIERGLQDGIRYCHAIRAQQRNVFVPQVSAAPSPLKHLVEDACEPEAVASQHGDASEEVERILNGLLSKRQTADVPELVKAIEFLRKTATER